MHVDRYQKAAAFRTPVSQPVKPRIQRQSPRILGRPNCVPFRGPTNSARHLLCEFLPQSVSWALTRGGGGRGLGSARNCRNVLFCTNALFLDNSIEAPRCGSRVDGSGRARRAHRPRYMPPPAGHKPQKGSVAQPTKHPLWTFQPPSMLVRLLFACPALSRSLT